MNILEAEKIMRDWEKKKNENPDLICEHPKGFEPEILGEGKDEDFVCPICGHILSREERKIWIKEHEK